MGISNQERWSQKGIAFLFDERSFETNYDQKFERDAHQKQQEVDLDVMYIETVKLPEGTDCQKGEDDGIALL